METTTRKQKLITALKLVITNLKNDTVHYDWNKQISCNCGLVAQSILKLDHNELNKLVNPIMNKLEKKYENQSNRPSITWQLGVKEFCPISGKPLEDIFTKLFENGLTKEDIVHLEYMTNPAILKRSKIKTSRFPYFGKKIGSLFPIKYYADSNNLIKYLQAWVAILEEGVESHYSVLSGTLSKNELEKVLLVAVANEDFEKAAEVRDLIYK